MTSRTAVVTGGASGIGQSAARALVGEGWRVCSFDLSTSQAPDTIDCLRHQVCDVSNRDSIRAAFAAVAEETPTLDALVCSAGVIRPAALMEQEEEDVDLMLRVNIKGPWLVVREALPFLKAAVEKAGEARVVMVGSGAGIRPKAGSGMYAATKAALHSLTAVMGVELGPQGILVNAVAPGSVATPMLRGALTDATASSGYAPTGASPLGRIAQPEDIADVITFLLGPAARYVNGAVLPVDGGTRAAIFTPRNRP